MQKRHFFRKKRGLEDWRGFAFLSPREGTERLGIQPKWRTSQPIRQTSQPYTYFNKTNTETSQPENGQSKCLYIKIRYHLVRSALPPRYHLSVSKKCQILRFYRSVVSFCGVSEWINPVVCSVMCWLVFFLRDVSKNSLKTLILKISDLRRKCKKSFVIFGQFSKKQ